MTSSCCSQVNATEPHYWEVNIGSGNGLLLTGNKVLPEPISTRSMLLYGITKVRAWWYHNMKTLYFHNSGTLCGESTSHEFPPERPNAELWCFIFIDLNKLLNKQLSCQLSEMPWCSCDVTVMDLQVNKLSVNSTVSYSGDVTVMQHCHTCRSLMCEYMRVSRLLTV